MLLESVHMTIQAKATVTLTADHLCSLSNLLAYERRHALSNLELLSHGLCDWILSCFSGEEQKDRNNNNKSVDFGCGTERLEWEHLRGSCTETQENSQIKT